MFIVAVTRWGPGLDQQLLALATQLELFPYDLRLRLAGPLPVVVARMPSREDAGELLEQLRAWGHGVVGCDEATVANAASMLQPREFAFEGPCLRVEDPHHRRGEIAADQVFALIHAMVLAEHRQAKTTSTKQFSAARAVLSGGMMMTRSSTQTAHGTESESEERIYVIRRDWTEPVLLCQHQLHYAGLGDELDRSSHTNFARLVARLRAWCPDAWYSAQLRETRRKGSFLEATTAKAGKTTTTTVTNSNVSETDLAAHLLVIARARAQL